MICRFLLDFFLLRQNYLLTIFFIDRVAGVIIRLVAPVCVCVDLDLG